MNSYMVGETRKWLMQQGVCLPKDTILTPADDCAEVQFVQGKARNANQVQSRTI